MTRKSIEYFPNYAEQIVGRERRERDSQLAWCGEGCFDSRRRVNSTAGHAFRLGDINESDTPFPDAFSILRNRRGWSTIRCHAEESLRRWERLATT